MRQFDFDSVLKDLFQRERPRLLAHLTGGVAIKQFLNVELPSVRARRVDLVLLLEDRTILHIELQSRNDARMAHRMAEYWLFLMRRYGRPLRQVVLYVGSQKLSMSGRVETDNFRFRCSVFDIRELSADDLLASGNSGDLALAVLAGGGDARIRRIVQKAAAVRGTKRDEVLARVLMLAGLRGIVGKVEWELKQMSVIIDIRKNPVLMRWHREAVAEGKAEVFGELLEAKFGPLPKWAAERLSHAKPVQLERWTKKILVAHSLEGVLGRK